MIDFFFALLIFLFYLEVFFIYRDSLCVYKFIKTAPIKKDIFKYFAFGLLKIVLFFMAVILISLLLNFIPYSYYWIGRNEALIEALRPNLNEICFFRFIYWFIFPLSCFFILVIKRKKKKLALSIVFPIVAFIGVISLLLGCFDYNFKYYKNPLADTSVSKTFKPLNVPFLKEGMSKKEVMELLGDPIYAQGDTFHYAKANGYGWYDYFNLDVYFENDVVIKIDKGWHYED